MTSDTMDYYDVQAAIRAARSEIRGETDSAIREAVSIMARELASLRDDLLAIKQTLNARTEHLV